MGSSVNFLVSDTEHMPEWFNLALGYIVTTV
jgi:hypothetical protein